MEVLQYNLLKTKNNNNKKYIYLDDEKLYLYSKYFLQIFLALKLANVWFIIELYLSIKLEVLKSITIFIYPISFGGIFKFKIQDILSA